LHFKEFPDGEEFVIALKKSDILLHRRSRGKSKKIRLPIIYRLEKILLEKIFSVKTQ
jgi:hypothetical protein